jgi:hypothetical protein
MPGKQISSSQGNYLVGFGLCHTGLQQIVHVIEQLHFPVTPLEFIHQSQQFISCRLGARLCALACCNIADIALDHSPAIDQVHVADELHLFVLARFGFQRQIFITDVIIVCK